ncbi:hypothetical protein TraAM80_10008 [Trypanosoma rangeli]|uniref:Uncharacterized protein n=1 Tax=Trypanosoma rangeli TaxID=5698 RepID=A0A3R7N403_TRYRA|nr:uncharacterized protein TraAM80_10008 [Trypanosoma rangeli]RNE96071.1 hypothetical protein TraAM80_10008 [Trypanosoma rangeli]|eukprot:RNE96071.1 hypothetical protein TraAM80_10008 [Trypanosoma rangeli]
MFLFLESLCAAFAGQATFDLELFVGSVQAPELETYELCRRLGNRWRKDLLPIWLRCHGLNFREVAAGVCLLRGGPIALPLVASGAEDNQKRVRHHPLKGQRPDLAVPRKRRC